MGADLDRGDAADLSAVQHQLEALVRQARRPGAAPGRLQGITGLFDAAYARMLARCPAKRPPDGVLQGFERIAVILGRPVSRQALACAPERGAGGGYVASGGGAGLKVSGVSATPLAHSP